MTREIRQYTTLRLTVIGIGAALFFVMIVSSVRLWPVVNQALHPTKLDCGCAVVAIHTSWWMTFAAAAILTLTLYTILRFFVTLGRHYWQYRQALFHLERQGRRTMTHSGSTEAISVIPDVQPVAYTIGLVHPRIIVSEGLLNRLSAAEVAAVLRHEQAHQRAHDPLIVMLIDSMTSAWHWLPGARRVMREAYSLRELAADAQATDDYRSASDLSSAFIKLHDIATHPVLSAFSPNRDRLEKLINHEWTSARRWWNWTSVIAIAMILVGGVMIGRSARAADTEIPAAATVACHETMVMCHATPAPTTTLTSICTANRCVNVERPWSSRYGLTLVH